MLFCREFNFYFWFLMTRSLFYSTSLLYVSTEVTHHQEFISRDIALETEVSFDLPYSIKYKIHMKIYRLL